MNGVLVETLGGGSVSHNVSAHHSMMNTLNQSNYGNLTAGENLLSLNNDSSVC